MINISWGGFIVVFILMTVAYCIKNMLLKKIILTIIRRTPTTLDDDMYPLLNHMLNIIIFGSGIVYALIQFGVDIRAILATAGASSLVIAYALKDTLTNVMSGIMLMIDRPFRIGDSIKLSSGEKVIVYDIGLRRTKFIYTSKDDFDSILIIANVDLLKNKVFNYTYAENLNDI